MNRLFIIFIIFISINYTIDAESEEFQLPNNQKIESFIKEMVFIIKEHSGYAIAHPKVFENVIRHLKHTCHAIDPNVVVERPMPAPEIGLNKAIKYYISKNEETSIYQLISSTTDKFANLCRNNLYTDSEKKLLSIAKDINSEFIIFYKKL